MHSISVDDETLGFLIQHFDEHFKNLEMWLDEHKNEESLRYILKKQEKQICEKLINQLEKVECE